MHTDVHQFLYRESVGDGCRSKLSISSCKVPNDLHSLVGVSYVHVCVTTPETDTTNHADVNTLVFSFSLDSKLDTSHIRKILITACLTTVISDTNYFTTNYNFDLGVELSF